MLRHTQVAVLILSFSVALAQTPLSSNSNGAQESLTEARKIYSEQGPRAALPKFEQTLALFRENGDRRGEAISLGQIGNCYERLGDYPRALEHLGRALAMKQELGDQTKIAEQTGIVASSAQIRSGAFQELTRGITVTTATDGNHGRSVAWGASLFHCQCVVYVPQTCSRNRELAIASYGAEVIRSPQGYDRTVHECARDAEKHGWLLVSDTSWDGYEEVPALVMQGYTVMSAEVVKQLGPAGPPTHIFVQGGVGGLAASVYAYFSNVWREHRPKLVLVEPSGAACLFSSATVGKPTPANGEVHTIMAGLECGEVSAVAWKFLAQGADFFMTVPDSVVPGCMRLLACSPYGDIPIVAGESAIAGLAGLLRGLECPQTRAQIGLNPKSTVLLFGTESDTDPDLYRELTGTVAVDVRDRSD